MNYIAFPLYANAIGLQCGKTPNAQKETISSGGNRRNLIKTEHVKILIHDFPLFFQEFLTCPELSHLKYKINVDSQIKTNEFWFPSHKFH